MPTRTVTHEVDNDFDAYLFDMDGTIYLGNGVLPGVFELMDAIAAAHRKRAFVTNNSTRTRSEYVEKLNRLGIVATEDEVHTSGTLTAAWVKQHHPNAVCFVCGEPPLLDELRRQKVQLSTDPNEINMVISSYDRTFEYWKLQTAFDALRNRPETRFIATHPDLYCPFPGGRGEPDAAAITAAIEACTSRKVELVVGKPNSAMMATALSLLGVPVERAVMVGDRIRTDIAMGIAAGTSTALVLTGDTSLADLDQFDPADLPDYVLECISSLADPLQRALV